MEHGKDATYTKGCRCSECRAAHAAYMRAYTARRREQKPVETERECTKCHVTKLLEAFTKSNQVKSGYLRVCKECKNAYLRDYMANSADQRRKLRERKWEWRAVPENRAYENAQGYARAKDDPVRTALRYRKHLLKKQYGLTLERYDEMVEEQHGGCAICGEPPDGKHKYFHVDHNHETMIVRGLLCSRCNTAIGLFKEDIDRMKLAIKYLEDH